MATTNLIFPQDIETIDSDPRIYYSKDLFNTANESSASSDLSILLNFLGDDRNRHTYQTNNRTKGIRKVTAGPSYQSYKNEFMQYMGALKDDPSFLFSEISESGEIKMRVGPPNDNEYEYRLVNFDSLPAAYKKSYSMPYPALQKDALIDKREKLKSKTWVLVASKPTKPGEVLKPSRFAQYQKSGEKEKPDFLKETKTIKSLSKFEESEFKNKKHKQELRDFLNFVGKSKKVLDSTTVSNANENNLFTTFKMSDLREYIKNKETKESIMN